ncbi:hypothetical protein AVEN_23162-1 [Araneus ventricosus]|uniref:Uncharacterized protein n=1 Tax=Araneus ventricosus TaxID=182803 RepID=A0A4Y2FI07_ARAVE|nr:hypothetical protein AVEN_23162-1 [Araneus ventricosus]
MTSSSHVWFPDLGDKFSDHLGDKFGDFGDEIWDLKGAGIFSMFPLGEKVHCVRTRQFGTGGSQVRNPIPLKIRRRWGLLKSKSYVVAKRPPAGDAKAWKGVPAQVSSSSSDRGSKLRGPSLNSPHVASKPGR